MRNVLLIRPNLCGKNILRFYIYKGDLAATFKAFLIYFIYESISSQLQQEVFRSCRQFCAERSISILIAIIHVLHDNLI